MTPPRPPLARDREISLFLPADLQEALDAEAALYRPVRVRPEPGSVQQVSAELIRLLPEEPAGPSWLGGGLLARGDEAAPLFAGEVVHVEPTTGAVYAASRRKEVGALERLQTARWIFEPFDFSAALRSAAESCALRPRELQRSLAAVSGAGKPPANLPFWEQPWALLWGPPGTGKTHQLADYLAGQVRVAGEQVRLLAVAPTNRAADELAERVASTLGEGFLSPQAGGTCPIFRGGIGVGAGLVTRFPAIVREPELRLALGRVATLEQELLRLSARKGTATTQAQVRQQLATLRRSLPDPTFTVVKRNRTPLVIVTLHRALKLVGELSGVARFSRLLIDEAGMVPRAAAALLATLADQVLLAGDPRQLGPVTQALEGEGLGVRTWLRRSPLSHLADAAAAQQQPHLKLLKLQHRMHPEVGEVVSRFAYSGLLEHGPSTRERQAPTPEGFPLQRALWVVLDESEPDARKVAHERGARGRGYQRPASAELALRLAQAATGAGLSSLFLTPYRAQAQRVAAAAAGLEGFTASTIHRQQGSEADVVVVDTVAGGRPFAPEDLAALLNVAASRARHWLLVLASRAEAETTTAGTFLQLLQPVRLEPGDPLRLTVLEPQPTASARPLTAPTAARALGEEVDALLARAPLFTQEQLTLFERNLGEGHYLVRGVAGSGKSFVVAEWAVRHLLRYPEHRVLITYFNLGLASVLERMLRRAAEARTGQGASALLERVTVQHAQRAITGAEESWDAVFVDEAQDFDAATLGSLYRLGRYGAEQGGRRLKAFLLFADDSQNVYGHRPLEELTAALPDKLSFAGRVRVLKEAFRSTQEILELAFNTVLDPRKRHTLANPGMRETLKVRELVEAGLLTEPEEDPRGLFRVGYTERRGVLPKVKSFRNQEEEHRWLRAEVRRLLQVEQVPPGSILIVTPARPQRIAEALRAVQLPAVAYGGSGGEAPARLKATGEDHVRVTTVFSCKGHESPIVFFAGLDALDEIGWMNLPTKSVREEERVRRSLFYVGVTRAMVRLYLSGQERGRFVQAAEGYLREMGGGRPNNGA